jgi:hypothetical protein
MGRRRRAARCKMITMLQLSYELPNHISNFSRLRMLSLWLSVCYRGRLWRAAR